MEYLFSPGSCIRRGLVLTLMIIHEFTKYHTARTIMELFYWPDGLCLDMFVVGTFFLAGMWCLYQDVKYFTAAYKNVENQNN